MARFVVRSGASAALPLPHRAPVPLRDLPGAPVPLRVRLRAPAQLQAVPCVSAAPLSWKEVPRSLLRTGLVPRRFALSGHLKTLGPRVACDAGIWAARSCLSLVARHCHLPCLSCAVFTAP